MTVSAETPIILLYTACLEGQLDFLPKLFTRLRQERYQEKRPVLLVDLGRSCSPEAWVCESTGGRGMLVAMDAIGYDAFHIGPQDMLYTQPILVEQMKHIIVTPLAAGPWTGSASRGDNHFMFFNAAQLANIVPTSSPVFDLFVGLRLSANEGIEVKNVGTEASPRRLVIVDSGLPTGTPGARAILGRIDIALLPEMPYIRLVSHTQLELSPDLLPDPTIAGVIEFVQSEAHYAERKRGQD